MPSDEDDLHHTVTVDLNGQVIVRPQGHDSKVPTELVLSRSSASGENLRFTTNRKYLARAVKLGFRELHVYGTENPVQAQGPNRVYVWAPLGEHGVIKEPDKQMSNEDKENKTFDFGGLPQRDLKKNLGCG